MTIIYLIPRLWGYVKKWKKKNYFTTQKIKHIYRIIYYLFIYVDESVLLKTVGLAYARLRCSTDSIVECVVLS